MSALRKGARIAAAGVTVTDVQSVKAERDKPDQDRVASFIDGVEQALDEPVRVRAPTRRDLQSLPDGAVRRRGSPRGVKRGCASRSNAPACVIP